MQLKIENVADERDIKKENSEENFMDITCVEEREVSPDDELLQELKSMTLERCKKERAR